MDYHHHARLTIYSREQLAKCVVEGRLSLREGSRARAQPAECFQMGAALPATGRSGPGGSILVRPRRSPRSVPGGPGRSRGRAAAGAQNRR